MSMNRLSHEHRVSIVRLLIEGVSINAIVRLTGIAKTSILRFVAKIGAACMNFEDRMLRGLHVAEIEADEVWAFCYCKAKNLATAKTPVEGAGDCWTWFAVDRNSKAILSWVMGERDEGHAHALMHDLASRLASRPDLSTDGLHVYANAVADAFARLGVDYSTVRKIYDKIDTRPGREDLVVIDVKKTAVFGTPDLNRAGTSRVERSNLHLRMSQRRWTRKTNAHGKKFENNQAAFALHACVFNWARPHASLEGKSPAMILGVADHVWSVSEIVGLLDAEERSEVGTDKRKRGTYKKSSKPA